MKIRWKKLPCTLFPSPLVASTKTRLGYSCDLFMIHHLRMLKTIYLLRYWWLETSVCWDYDCQGHCTQGFLWASSLSCMTFFCESFWDFACLPQVSKPVNPGHISLFCAYVWAYMMCACHPRSIACSAVWKARFKRQMKWKKRKKSAFIKVSTWITVLKLFYLVVPSNIKRPEVGWFW